MEKAIRLCNFCLQCLVVGTVPSVAAVDDVCQVIGNGRFKQFFPPRAEELGQKVV